MAKGSRVGPRFAGKWRLRVVAAGVGASLLAPVWAAAAPATTTPSTTLLVEVVIGPKSVIVGRYASSATHDGLIPSAGPTIPRGDFLNFKIFNRGHRPASFTAFGRRTLMIKPGGTSHFNVLAIRRGFFPYRAVVVGGKTVRGVFVVA